MPTVEVDLEDVACESRLLMVGGQFLPLCAYHVHRGEVLGKPKLLLGVFSVVE